MPSPTPALLISPVQGNVGASNTFHLRFDIFGEDNAETLFTNSGKGLAVYFSDDIGGPTLDSRINSNAHGHVMFHAQTQNDYNSGDIFYEE